MQKKKERKSRPRPYSLHKNELKKIIDLNIKCKTRKLIEVNKGDNTDDLWYGNDFLDDTKGMIFERNN